MKFLIFAMILGVALAAGCVSQPAQNNTTGPQLREFTLTISHTFYSPDRIEVNQGDTVKLNVISSRGTGVESYGHNHGITIDEYNLNVAAASEVTPLVVQFTADKAGTFEIYCRTCKDGPFGAGHPDIKATFIVK